MYGTEDNIEAVRTWMLNLFNCAERLQNKPMNGSFEELKFVSRLRSARRRQCTSYVTAAQVSLSTSLARHLATMSQSETETVKTQAVWDEPSFRFYKHFPRSFSKSEARDSLTPLVIEHVNQNFPSDQPLTANEVFGSLGRCYSA